MSEHTETDLGFSVDPSGLHRRLHGIDFSSRAFEEFSLGPVLPPESSIKVTDCSFVGCSVMSGEFVIRAGVELRNVTFDAMSSGDSMIVSTNALLDQVVVRGKPKHGGLWVRPDEVFDAATASRLQAWTTTNASDVATMLDISDYDATHIEVIGLPLKKVRFDPDRHAAINSAMFEALSRSDSGFSPTGFWRLSARRLRTFGQTSGIFLLPTKGQKEYSIAMEELSQLQNLGAAV